MGNIGCYTTSSGKSLPTFRDNLSGPFCKGQEFFFFRKADENCDLLGYHEKSSGNSLPTFRDNLSVRNFRNSPKECSSHLLRGRSLKSRCVCLSASQYSVTNKPKTRAIYILHICAER